VNHAESGRATDFFNSLLGKNPGDVWDIPNVKAKHPEKTTHPCQFPVALAQRLVRSLTEPGQLVLDPFMGSGSTGVAAVQNQRNFIGGDVLEHYVQIAFDRLTALGAGELKVRDDVPPRTPIPGEAVAIRPAHFLAPELTE